MTPILPGGLSSAHDDESGGHRRVGRAEPARHGRAVPCAAEPSRLTILEHLFLGEHRVVDLVAHLGLAQSTVSQHLACLRDCGLVNHRAVGRSSHYSLTDPTRIRTLLDEAERWFEATGGLAAGHDGAH